MRVEGAEWLVNGKLTMAYLFIVVAKSITYNKTHNVFSLI